MRSDLLHAHARQAHRHRALAASLVLAASALLASLWPAVAWQGASLGGTGLYQMQNLAAYTLETHAGLYALDGTLVWSTTHTLAPDATYAFTRAFTQPVTSTFALDARGLLAGTYAALTETAGNEAYPLAPPRSAGTPHIAPWLVRDTRTGGTTSQLVVIAAPDGPDAPFTATLTLLHTNGQAAGTFTQVVSATAWFDLATFTTLPDGWKGAGLLTVNRSASVTVIQQGPQRRAVYRTTSVSEADTVLYAPWLAPHQPGLLTSTLQLFNPGASTAFVTIQFTPDAATTVALGSGASTAVNAPSAWKTPGSALISSSLPVLAVVQMTTHAEGRAGALAYPAFTGHTLSTEAALPLVLSGYADWTHAAPPGALRLYNAGTITATITLNYTPALSPYPAFSRVVTLGPLSASDLPLPADDASTWTLTAHGDQALALLGIAFRTTPTADHWLAAPSDAYRLQDGRIVYLPLMQR